MRWDARPRFEFGWCRRSTGALHPRQVDFLGDFDDVKVEARVTYLGSPDAEHVESVRIDGASVAAESVARLAEQFPTAVDLVVDEMVLRLAAVVEARPFLKAPGSGRRRISDEFLVGVAALYAVNGESVESVMSSFGVSQANAYRWIGAAKEKLLLPQ